MIKWSIGVNLNVIDHIGTAPSLIILDKPVKLFKVTGLKTVCLRYQPLSCFQIAKRDCALKREGFFRWIEKVKDDYFVLSMPKVFQCR